MINGIRKIIVEIQKLNNKPINLYWKYIYQEKMAQKKP